MQSCVEVGSHLASPNLGVAMSKGNGIGCLGSWKTPEIVSRDGFNHPLYNFAFPTLCFHNGRFKTLHRSSAALFFGNALAATNAR